MRAPNLDSPEGHASGTPLSARLGVSPNERSHAPLLGGPLTHTVGLIIGNISNPFYSAVHRAVEDVAAAYGTVVIAASLDEDASNEARLVAAFMRRNMDGIIFTPALSSQRYLQEHVNEGARFACVDRRASNVSLDTVLCDNREAAEAAVAHLASFGHRRIAFIGNMSNVWTNRERETGFRDGCAKAGIATADIVTIDGVGNETVAREKALALLRSPHRPTAIFTSYNLVTIGVLRALQEQALNRQVALIGFDDFVASDLIRPAVTVMAQDPYRIGEEAALMLFDRILGHRTETETRVVRAELIERGSGELPPLW